MVLNPFLWKNLDKADKRKIFCPGRLFWVRLPIQNKYAGKKLSEMTAEDAEKENSNSGGKISSGNTDWLLVPAVLLEAPVELQVASEQEKKDAAATAAADKVAGLGQKSASRFSVLALVAE